MLNLTLSRRWLLLKSLMLMIMLNMLASCGTPSGQQPIQQANKIDKPYTIKKGETKVAPYDSICAPAATWMCIPAN